jgi:arylsulfatase A-like enzyme
MRTAPDSAAAKSSKTSPSPPTIPTTNFVRSDPPDYAVEVEYADAHIARALRKLEALGELDNTLIVVTSDHGMPFPA